MKATVKTKRNTSPIRVRTDLALMASAIAWYERINVSDLVDPLIAQAITKRFSALPKEVRDRAMSPKNRPASS